MSFRRASMKSALSSCRIHPALKPVTLVLLISATAFSARAETPFRPAEEPIVAAIAAAAPSNSAIRPSQDAANTDTPSRWPSLSPAHTRWRASLDAFARADRERHPDRDGVLFVGSSTIRLWSQLAQDFSQNPVITNRGFGGSTMRDCNALVRELVIQYRPKEVVVYAGDNDLAEGRTPAEVLDSFAGFVDRVRAGLPDTRIAYISIKPSPARVALLDRIRETNALIADYIRAVPSARYIDIFTPMLDADGSPRAELFRGDRLHLNDAGYRLWQSVIATDLSARPTPRAMQHQQAAADRL
jgi:lysophospholipase L1-like esterase